MGLCISVAKKIQPLKINGTTITQDEWEGIMMPDLDNFAYRLHPDRLKSDQKEYEQIQNYFEQDFEQDNEADYLDMGYGTFNCYREIILRNAGVDMRAGNADHASDSDISIKEICPCFSHYMFDDYYYHWNDEKYTKEDDHAIQFLIHQSDCDGEYSNAEIKKLDQLILHYPLLPKCEQYLKDSDRLKGYKEFIEFVHKYAQSDYYFIFC